MERIYHHYTKWEDHKHELYILTDEDKEDHIQKSYELLKNEIELETMMTRVINEWIFSCEQNLSNIALNRQAYLGQAACCLNHGSPAFITKKAWNLLTDDEMKKANKIADRVIAIWESRYADKS